MISLVVALHVVLRCADVTCNAIQGLRNFNTCVHHSHRFFANSSPFRIEGRTNEEIHCCHAGSQKGELSYKSIPACFPSLKKGELRANKILALAPRNEKANFILSAHTLSGGNKVRLLR